MSEPFSFAELAAAADSGAAAPVESLAASDGVALAYRRYVPDDPRAVLVFHHGGGAHSGAGYPHLARGLRDEFAVATYTPDLRGHGHSGGERGDAPSAEQLWRDVRTFVEYVRGLHPDRPVFVGGHSSGAGLCLNFASWPERSRVEGYVFLSPQLGHRSDTTRAPDPNHPRPAFAAVRIAPFAINALSRGWWMGHERAVVFRYPPELLARDAGMVGFNTVNLANGLTPRAPREQFARLDRPFGLWIGEQDELFAPDRVMAYGALAKRVRDQSVWEVVPEQSHLGILLGAHTRIGPFLDDPCPATAT